MASPYHVYLHMNNLLKELPESFYDKLDDTETKKVNEIIRAVHSLVKRPAPDLSKQLLDPVSNQLQLKDVIFCLILKKLLNAKKLKFTKFSFGLIRCLFKEVKRNEHKNKKYLKILNLEPYSKEIGTNTQESETYDSPQKAILNEPKKDYDEMLSDKNAAKLHCETLKKISVLIRFLNKILAKRLYEVIERIVENKKNKLFSIKILFFSLSSLKKRIVQSLFFKLFSKTDTKPKFTIECNDFIPKFNNKQKALLEMNENSKLTLSSMSKDLKSPKSLESENFEDYTPGNKRVSKIIKKKKALVSKSKPSASKLSIINKNHAWVLAFAILKWKKKYFSIKSSSQKKSNIASLALELLSNSVGKHQIKMKSVIFENLKLKYSILKSSNMLKICLFVNSLTSIFKNQNKFYLFIAFQLISKFQDNENFYQLNTVRYKPDYIEGQFKIFYKKLKKFIKNILIKQKIFGFLAIQNYYVINSTPDHYKILNNLFTLLQKMILIKKYIYFYDLKEELYLKDQKVQFFSDTIERIIRTNRYKMLFNSILALKCYNHGAVECFVRTLSKVYKKSNIRHSFSLLMSYTIHLNNFLYLRALFTQSLITKIYFKKLSFSIM